MLRFVEASYVEAEAPEKTLIKLFAATSINYVPAIILFDRILYSVCSLKKMVHPRSQMKGRKRALERDRFTEREMEKFKLT
jgi:hypothetical protein